MALEERNEEEEVLRHIKDTMNDLMPISTKLSGFIDTKQFQRLRHIKQLGTTHYVWPCASHSRFEHCLGVAYLARRIAEQLQKSQPELGITSRDIACVEIAGLCHDLGHGPWSHVWDSLFMPTALPGCQWKHEDGSELMFDSLVESNNINLPLADAQFIKALIAGERGQCPAEKPFLFDIVANKLNGLDVDKFDYLARDSHMLRMAENVNVTHIINSARVIDQQICYNIKDINIIHQIYLTRFTMHKMIYNHKTAKAIEYMIVDALISAEPTLKIASQVYEPTRFLYLTDHVLTRIESSTEPELAPARAITDRISVRDLYKCVDYKVIDWEHHGLIKREITAQKILDAAKARFAAGLPAPSKPQVATKEPREASESPTDVSDEDQIDVDDYTGPAVDIAKLNVNDIVVDLSVMHYEMKEKNPLKSVRFYSKNNRDKCIPAAKGDYSSLMPRVFAEVLLRIYTKDSRFFGVIQAGYREVLSSLHLAINDDSEDESSGDVEVVVKAQPQLPLDFTPEAGDERIGTSFIGSRITPPVTEAPSTPPPQYPSGSFININAPDRAGSASMSGNDSIAQPDLDTAAAAGPSTTASNRRFGRTRSLPNNEFTTVDPTYAPSSPAKNFINPKLKSSAAASQSSLKRERDILQEPESPSPKKKKPKVLKTSAGQGPGGPGA